MNKEQWTLVASLGLLALGVYLAVNRWMPEKVFQPPAREHRRVTPLDVSHAEPLLFTSEDELGFFREEARNPFAPKRETEPLPLAELALPPFPGLTRVLPSPRPGLGGAKLKVLEEELPVETIDLTVKGGEEEEEDLEEEEDEWGRRRY